MGRHGWINETWSAECRDPNGWPPVHPGNLSRPKRDRFERRKLALDLYLTSPIPVTEVLVRAKMQSSELRRLINRAFTPSADGRPFGYHACIPGYRIKPYERKQDGGRGHAGRFDQFLRTHPKVREHLDNWALGRKKIGETKIRGRSYKRIWQAFRALCDDLGINVNTQYPFTNRDGGREAVRRYCTRLKTAHEMAGIKVDYGDAAGYLATSSTGFAARPPGLRPYSEVQLDGHRLDTALVVRLDGADGEWVDVPMSRIWLLVAIDVASRAVLGYSLSLSENYTSEDVLDCIQSIYKPWAPFELPTDRIHYHAGGGLPSGVISVCAGRAFDRLRMDNAWSQSSAWTQQRIIASGANEVTTNQPKRPRSNAIVERFMRTFEESSLHQFPTTTGSGPNDPRRRSPEKAAKQLLVTFEDLQIVTDVTIANYNIAPHMSLNGLSPLEYIQRRIDRGRDFIRHVSDQDRDGVHLHEVEYPVTLRRNAKQSHRLSFKFLHVRYSSEDLMARADLDKRRAIFRTNLNDLRTGIVFLDDGTCLGPVQADMAWMAQPHSFRIRRAIFKLIREKKLQSDSMAPISDYLKYLADEAPTGRKERNRLLDVRRRVGEVPARPKRSTVRLEQARRGGWLSIDGTYARGR